MRTINGVIVFIIIFSTCAFGQRTLSDSISIGRDSIIKSTNSIEAEKIISALYKKMDSLSVNTEKEYMGKFKLYNLKPNVYSKVEFLSKLYEKKKAEKEYKSNLKKIKKGVVVQSKEKVIKIFEKSDSEHIEIEKVELNISEGVIENIRVTTKSSKYSDIRIFENIKSIPLQNLDIAALKTFLFDVRDRDFFIKINDFMYFLPEPGQYYLPDDASFTLNSDNNECKLNASIDLNSNLDIRVYSDFLSLFNKASNGLIQTEARTKIIFNSIPTISNCYFLNFVEPSVRYSKFDSKYSSVEIRDSIGPLFISQDEKLKMNQLSYLNLGFKVNVIRTKLFQTFTELNVGCTYDFVDIKIKNITKAVSANMFSCYIEDRGGIAKSKYFGLNYSLGVLFQNVCKTGLDFFTIDDTYVIPEITAYFFPKGDSSNKLFLRFKSFSDVLTAESFPMFQFGYSTKLNFKKN